MTPTCDDPGGDAVDGRAGACPRCGDLGERPAGERLLLAPPLGHTGGKVLRTLTDAGAEPERHEDGLISASADPPMLRRLVEDFRDELEPREREETRALLFDGQDWPEPARMLRASSWQTLAGRIEGDWLRTLLSEDRLTVHFQPIVAADEPSRVVGHECLARGRATDGTVVPPGRLFSAARQSRRLFELDRAARLAAVRAATAVPAPEKIFINFNPTAVYDPEYCLRTTVAAVEESEISPSRVVFEVVETDDVEDIDALLRILDYYRDAGFRVALDDLGSGYGSLSLLTRLKPDVVKLDMELVRDVHRTAYRAEVSEKILELAADLGVTTVAEGIEVEEEWRWIRDHGADLASGYYFGRPSPDPTGPSDSPAA